MIKIVEKSDCCGCCACVQKCPKQCIKLKADNEGFLYPNVDINNCINCGLCEKVCPIINAAKLNFNSQAVDTLVAYCKDDNIRAESSSGGIFSIIANYILSHGGIIFGAAFDKDFSVHHIKAENYEELSLLRGSKYVQSRIENTYKQAEVELKNGRLVLFTGTACQIAGLYGYLGKKYDNLITVDVLCHGVGSPDVWLRHLDEIKDQYHSEISEVTFRSKDFGWRRYAVKINFKNGMCYLQDRLHDDYSKLFLQAVCLRPSCHKCYFKGMDRPSDITIGDGWGVENYHPNLDDNKGVSTILVHNIKGKDVIEKILCDLHYEDSDLDSMLSVEANSRHSTKAHPKRKKFFKLFNKGQRISNLSKLAKSTFLMKISNKINYLKKRGFSSRT